MWGLTGRLCFSLYHLVWVGFKLSLKRSGQAARTASEVRSPHAWTHAHACTRAYMHACMNARMRARD